MKTIALLFYVLIAIACVVATKAPPQQPCDIYNHTGTPCVAAHSLVRALYASYSGPLFQVQRDHDDRTLDVPPTIPGGFAFSALLNDFCQSSFCFVTRIYDQSPRGNHLETAPGGGAAPHPDEGVIPKLAPVVVGNNQTVYGAYFAGGNGYRNDNTNGIAKGDEEETIYAVVAGDHYNSGCCFDYGNAEVNNLDDGAGAMECVYFGNSSGWGKGGGNGPWIMADLENGLWAGNASINPTNPSIVGYSFVTAMVKGGKGHFTLKGGNAQQGPLTTLYAGPRPNGYNPMKKQGAIILGIGGDNSNWAIGTFYEGVMTQGFSTDAADSLVQASIVAAGYKKK